MKNIFNKNLRTNVFHKYILQHEYKIFNVVSNLYSKFISSISATTVYYSVKYLNNQNFKLLNLKLRKTKMLTTCKQPITFRNASKS